MKKSTNRVVSILFVLFCLKLPAMGHTYYIAPDGDDSGAGTISSPWRTMGASAAKMAPGDLAYLRGGTYIVNEIVTSSGVAGAPLIFQAYPAEQPLIVGPSVSTGEDVDTIRVYGSYITLDFLAVTNLNDPGQAVWIADNAHNVTISHCDVFDARGVGILVSGDKNLLYQNKVHGMLASPYASITSGNVGIYIEGAQNIVRSNTVFQNTLAGIQVYRGYPGLRSDNIVEYNYVYTNGYEAKKVDPDAPVFGIALGGNEQSTTVRRNRVCDNDGYGIVLYDYMPNQHLEENITCHNQDGGLALLYPGDGNTATSNISFVDSKFALASSDGASSNLNDFYVVNELPQFIWNDQSYSGLIEFQQASGQDSSSTTEDPKFRNLPKDDFDPSAAMTYDFCNKRLKLFCKPMP